MLKKLIIIGIAASAIALAQGGRGGGGGGDMGGGGGDMSGGGGGGMSMARPSHLDQWTKDLKLNKDQKKSIKAIMDEGQKQANPLRDQMEKSREAAAESIAAAKSQDEIDGAVKKYAVLATQMASLELTCFAKIYKELDQEQVPHSGEIYSAMSGIFKTKNWNE